MGLRLVQKKDNWVGLNFRWPYEFIAGRQRGKPNNTVNIPSRLQTRCILPRKQHARKQMPTKGADYEVAWGKRIPANGSFVV